MELELWNVLLIVLVILLIVFLVRRV